MWSHSRSSRQSDRGYVGSEEQGRRFGSTVGQTFAASLAEFMRWLSYQVIDSLAALLIWFLLTFSSRVRGGAERKSSTWRG